MLQYTFGIPIHVLSVLFFILAVCTYSRLLEVLTPCSHKWYGIGLHLGLSIEKLAPLMEMSVTSEQILQEVLKMKLKSGEEVTWGDVVIALVKVDETGLAQKLAGTHTHAASKS